MLAGGDGVGETDLPGVEGFEDQEKGHDLGDAGRRLLQVGVLFVENGAGGCFHDDGTGRFHVKAGIGDGRTVVGRGTFCAGGSSFVGGAVVF